MEVNCKSNLPWQTGAVAPQAMRHPCGGQTPCRLTASQVSFSFQMLANKTFSGKPARSDPQAMRHPCGEQAQGLGLVVRRLVIADNFVKQFAGIRLKFDKF